MVAAEECGVERCEIEGDRQAQRKMPNAPFLLALLLLPLFLSLALLLCPFLLLGLGLQPLSLNPSVALLVSERPSATLLRYSLGLDFVGILRLVP